MGITIITSIAAYISTNIDDIFILMILLAQATGTVKRKLIAGHFLGVGVISLISMLGAFGLRNLPLQYVGLWGLVPIGLGIKAWLCRNREDGEAHVMGLASMAMITIGNGADNVGLYVPLFTGFSGEERIEAVIIFAAMTALWIWLAGTLAGFPQVKEIVERYKTLAVPVIFIALGVFILLDSGIIG